MPSIADGAHGEAYGSDGQSVYRRIGFVDHPETVRRADPERLRPDRTSSSEALHRATKETRREPHAFDRLTSLLADNSASSQRPWRGSITVALAAEGNDGTRPPRAGQGWG